MQNVTGLLTTLSARYCNQLVYQDSQKPRCIYPVEISVENFGLDVVVDCRRG